MISAARRESEQPKSTANGRCPGAVSARRAASWFGCCGVPATKRWLPASSSSTASDGVSGRASVMVPGYVQAPLTTASRSAKGGADAANRDGMSRAARHPWTPGGSDSSRSLKARRTRSPRQAARHRAPAQRLARCRQARCSPCTATPSATTPLRSRRPPNGWPIKGGRLRRACPAATGSGHGSCRSGTTLRRRTVLIAPARFRTGTAPVISTIEEATAASVGPPSR